MQQTHRTNGRDAGYGFGLAQIHDERFGTIVSHSGGLPGYGSNMRWLPGRRVGVVTLANATYAPMGTLSQQMLGVLADHDLVPPAAVPHAPALRRAAEQLVALLNAWDDGAADRLLADNVALDEPYARRARRPPISWQPTGRCTWNGSRWSRRRRAPPCCVEPHATIRIEIMLTPLASGCIERYTVRQ